MSPMRAVVLLIAAALLTPAQTPQPVREGLRGDPEALAMARTMLERMGGREVWAKAATLYIVEEVHHPGERLPYRSEAWRSLREPKIRGTAKSAELDRSFANTPEQGWSLRGGRLTTLDAMQVRQWLGRWQRNIYVMYHRLAREDPSLWLVKEQGRGFAVLDARSGERLCAFEVTAGGEVLRWSASFGVGTEEWIYGPLAEFGAVRMPAWGVRLQDSYRFYYREVRLSSSPPPVSFDPPPLARER